MLSETVHLDGHIIDSGTLSKVLDLILLHGGDYEITTFQIGTTREAASHAEIVVRADTEDVLHLILQEVGQHGANPVAHDAEWEAAPADGVFPPDFYSTTNLESYVRQKGQWLPIEQIEMDCGVTLVERADGPHALTVPVHRIRKGDRVLVHEAAVKVVVAPRKDPVSVFGFMSSEVSAERPKELTRGRRGRGHDREPPLGQEGAVRRAVPPSFIPARASISRRSSPAGGSTCSLPATPWPRTTSKRRCWGPRSASSCRRACRRPAGTTTTCAPSTRSGPSGSIRAAVDQGVLKSGVMHACVTHGVDFVLAGSIRDDGPLPDVITNTVTAQDEMRARVPGVGLAIMVATTLHSVATGNLLPATVRIICVDNNTDTITKLMDRGTRQAFGLVTDCQFFLKELAARLDGRSPTDH